SGRSDGYAAGRRRPSWSRTQGRSLAGGKARPEDADPAKVFDVLMAQAILLKDVDGLGDAGAVVDVSPGYLRNYLGPKKLAQSATPASIAAAQKRLEQAEEASRRQEERAQETAALLSKTVLTIP